MSPLVMFAVTIAAFLVAVTAAPPASIITTTDAATLTLHGDYTYDSYARRFYKEHWSPASWNKARDVCRQEGAELAYPDTPTQRAVLDSIQIGHVFDGEPADMWVGIFAAYNLRTIYNETVNIDDLTDGSQKGIYLAQNGSLLIADSTVELPFVCEISEAAACNPSVPGYAFGPGAQSCYKLHTTHKNWTEALLSCVAEGAQLTVINSQREADHLAGLAAAVKPTPPSYIHIGFHELFGNNTYFTVDGHPLASCGYEKWATGEPNHHDNENCGSITTKGQLNDIKCSEHQPFVCEKKAPAPVAALSNCSPEDSIFDSIFDVTEI